MTTFVTVTHCFVNEIGTIWRNSIGNCKWSIDLLQTDNLFFKFIRLLGPYFIVQVIHNIKNKSAHELLGSLHFARCWVACTLPFVLECFDYFALSVMQCQSHLRISCVKNIGSVLELSGVAFRLAPPYGWFLVIIITKTFSSCSIAEWTQHSSSHHWWPTVRSRVHILAETQVGQPSCSP